MRTEGEEGGEQKQDVEYKIDVQARYKEMKTQIKKQCLDIYDNKSSEHIRKLIQHYESDPNIRFALKSRLVDIELS